MLERAPLPASLLVAPARRSSRPPRLTSTRWWALTLARPQARALIIVLALAVAVPSIAVGFYTDDYTFLVALRHHLRPAFDLFRFSSGDTALNEALIAHGEYPWWTAPDFKLHLIRPLTSAMYALDDALFGNAPLGYHVDALLWYGALLVGASLLFKRLLPRTTATFALLVFALRSGHVLPYAWLSARHVLIAAVPAVFALVAHVKAARDGWKPGWVLGPVLLALALSGSEIALGIVPFWVAHDLFLAHGTHDRKAKRRALLASAPPVVMAGAYLVLYTLVGGGSASSPSYHNPLNDPASFLHVLPTRTAVLLADALLGVPVVFSIDGPQVLFVVAGLLGVVVCTLLLRACRPLAGQERAALTWLLPAAAAALLLGVSGPPWGHVLLLPDLAFASLIGILLRHGLDKVRALLAGRASRFAPIALAATAFLFVMHVVVAPAMAILTIHRLAQGGRITEDTAETAEVGSKPGARVFVMDSTDSMVFFYPRDVLAVDAPGKVGCWSVLSGAHAPHDFERTGVNSFSLKPHGEPDGDAFEALFFGARKFAVGDEVQQCGATIRVDALDHDKPSALSVTLDEPLEADDLALLYVQHDHLVRFPIPGVGGSVELTSRGPVAVTAAN